MTARDAYLNDHPGATEGTCTPTTSTPATQPPSSSTPSSSSSTTDTATSTTPAPPTSRRDGSSTSTKRRHIGGDDFQHGIDREQEADGIDAWRAREYDRARQLDMLRRPHLYDDDDVQEWGAGISHAGEFGIADR